MHQLLSRYQTASFGVTDPAPLKQQLLRWGSQFGHMCYLDSNGYTADPYGRYDCLVAVGVDEQLLRSPERHDTSANAFDQLRDFYEQQPDWLFAFLSYDLKNDTEQLQSNNPDGLGFPDIHVFRPVYVFELKGDALTIHSKARSPERIHQSLLDTTVAPPSAWKQEVQLRSRLSRTEYLEAIDRVRRHILVGDIYELNFCQEFYVEDIQLDPLHLFERLNRIARAPFAAFYKWNDRYLLCGSPERFLRKTGDRLISQPIKGTIGRGNDPAADARLRAQLAASQKDRSENVMIVDLVRNDLARSCRPGSVQVDELFGIYPFRQVHQMISTVSGRLRPEVHFTKALQYAYPMGSMTGAPKIRAMQLIEKYERSKRGLYSGSVGYIRPDGDFDFNVVIRSLLYNAARRYLSLSVGGAIVYDSVPELEYEECLLKAQSMLRALGV